MAIKLQKKGKSAAFARIPVPHVGVSQINKETRLLVLLGQLFLEAADYRFLLLGGQGRLGLFQGKTHGCSGLGFRLLLSHLDATPVGRGWK